MPMAVLRLEDDHQYKWWRGRGPDISYEDLACLAMTDFFIQVTAILPYSISTYSPYNKKRICWPNKGLIYINIGYMKPNMKLQLQPVIIDMSFGF